MRPDLAEGPQATFEVLLIGEDGGVMLHRERPAAGSELDALIDTMPMRRSEMKGLAPGHAALKET